jgi:squalene synthase HpnC
MDNAPVSVDHYENFPVASVLCPRPLRAAVVAIYRFARTADDIADEGDAAARERLDTLHVYRGDLAAMFRGEVGSGRWRSIFEPLRQAVIQHRLPWQPLDDLLDAFEQDTANPSYPNRAALLDYCRRSANPVGRLLLHLHGQTDTASLQRSDAICSALQLINFWQDLSVDLPRGRVYLPKADAARHGLDIQQLHTLRDGPALRALVRELTDWAESLMQQGAPLATSLPGRGGWELRLVVQGGLRVVRHIRRLDHGTAAIRPRLGAWDLPIMLWHASRMRSAKTSRVEPA